MRWRLNIARRRDFVDVDAKSLGKLVKSRGCGAGDKVSGVWEGDAVRVSVLRVRGWVNRNLLLAAAEAAEAAGK